MDSYACSPTMNQKQYQQYCDACISSAINRLAISVSALFITGAVGYSTWPEDNLTEVLLVVFVTPLLLAQLISLFSLHFNAAELLGRKIDPYVTSAIIGFGVSTARAVIFGCGHYYQAIFWSLMGLYMGVFAEMATGSSRRLAERLGQSH